MSDEKITISLDDVNSARVDAEIRRQEIATRMAAHQSRIEETAGNSRSTNSSEFFRRSIVYMAIFGLIASLVGWGLGEIAMHESGEAISRYLASQSSDAFDSCKAWNQLWYFLVALCVSVGLAIAEPFVSNNKRASVFNGVIGALLGCLGGFVVSLFVNDVYHFFGGAKETSGFIQQMFARGIGWSVLGLFVAIAPGIMMRNWKKFGLGLIGGAIGGLLGGVLFDIICALTGSDVPARCFNVVGLGLGAALATTFLEDLAKQGWLRVATGVITGKQFILYRNPTIIGSSPKCEIYLFKDPTVAAKHAAINGIGGQFLVTALGGATVLLNGRPVRQQTLKSGDTLKVGNTVFLFEARAIKKASR